MTGVVRVLIPFRLAALALVADRPGVANSALARAAAGQLLPVITAQYAAAGYPDDEAATARRRALLERATRPVRPESRGPYRRRADRTA